MCFVTVHRRPHPDWSPGSACTSVISLGKLKTNKLGINAQVHWWQHCEKSESTLQSPSTPQCPSHWPTLCHGSGKVGQMLRVKKAPVGEWEWCFGSEGETIKRREHGEVGGRRGFSVYHTWPALEHVQPSRRGPRRSFALKVGADKRVQANSNMILWLIENSGEMSEFTCLTFLKVCSETTHYDVTRGTDTQTLDRFPSSVSASPIDCARRLLQCPCSESRATQKYQKTNNKDLESINGPLTSSVGQFVMKLTIKSGSFFQLKA